MSDIPNQLIPAEDALQIVLADVSALEAETVDLKGANNRILASDLSALRTQPPFDASAMDGYAVRQVDIANLPATLKLIGQSRAGEQYLGNLGSGEAVRIFTGAVVPNGADSIIIQENTEASGESVTVLQGVEKGRFIRKAGLDFKEGEVLLKAGDMLTSSRLALAASMNHAKVPVVRKPTVALLSTGDELVMPGHATGPGQIIASNTFGLAASIENTGGRLIDLGLVADTSEALKNTFGSAIEQGADVIVTTGGASVGDHDLVLPSAKALGFEFEITKIAMRPGKPFLFGKLKMAERTIYLTGLAGNPVSSLVAYNVFVRPLIQTLGGGRGDAIAMQQAILGRDLPENDERAEFMRAVLAKSENGKLIATPFTSQDSSMLANLVRANCLLYRPVNAPTAKAGDPCQIVPIE
ncbi:MAG: gephyrin-like molybdotransferase Glp [Pseudomonadota bacterium]